MAKAIVLRDLSQSEGIGPFGAGLRGMHADPLSGPPQPHFAVEDLGQADIAKLSHEPSVVYIAPPMLIKLIQPTDFASPSDNDDAWGIEAVKADASRFNGAGATVAVLDTGIDQMHPAFTGVTLEIEDFSGSGNGDGNGHGTHCAGIAFGRDLDGRIGIANGVEKALIGKVLDDSGAGTSEMVFRGMQWAIEKGAHVVSMSVGFDFPGMVSSLVGQGWPTDLATSRALEAYRGNLRMFDALMVMIRAQEEFGKGAVVVAAAGNESKRELGTDYRIAASLPSAADGVVSVGAVQIQGDGYEIAPFSNSFPLVVAPGVSIKSAKSGGSAVEMSGTSMACPHVAGVAALWWEAAATLGFPPNPRAVAAKIIGSCRTDVFSGGMDLADRGSGLVTAP